MNCQFDADGSAPSLTGNAGHGRRHAAILSPGKCLQSNPCRFPRADESQRLRRAELRHCADLSERNNCGEPFSFCDERPHPKMGDFREAPGYRGKNPPLFNFVLEPLDRCRARLALSFELRGFLLKVVDTGSTVAFLSLLVSF